MELLRPDPAELRRAARPSRAYVRHARLAFAGVVGFVALYLGVTGWLAWHAWLQFERVSADAKNALGALFLGGIFAFLAFVLVKALFVPRARLDPTLVELHPAEEPELFQFLEALALQVGAPKPHRVYVSAQVNAAVFYEASLSNLLLPKQKNLEIGLGLVNALDRAEFAAVLAHEFGHFAQETTRVSRWVYVAQRVVGQAVARRDWLDHLLDTVSRIDIRVAWVAWILRLVVWSMRSVMDSVFRLVILAQRALSREMELQADLVAVSATGSDGLIHALHRLNAADEAWHRALSFANQELIHGRGVENLFAVQSRLQEHLRRALGDTLFGPPPSLPQNGAEHHRVFDRAIAQPPKMWRSHPPNREREDNAKRHYVPTPADPRPAWSLFADPTGICRRATTHFMQHCAPKHPEVAPLETTLENLDKEFALRRFDPRYQGLYVGYSAVRWASEPELLHGETPELNDAELRTALSDLYPEWIAGAVEQLRQLEEERATLQGLYDGFLTAPEGVVRHRGAVLRRRQVPDAIARVTGERDATRSRLAEQHRRCRDLHRIAAARLGGNWEAYLTGLARLLHYAEHTLADVRDVMGQLANVISVVTADGKVTKLEVQRLHQVLSDAFGTLFAVHHGAPQVLVPQAVAAAMQLESWASSFGKDFPLKAPAMEKIGASIDQTQSVARAIAIALDALSDHTLDELLRTEELIAKAFTEQSSLEPAPPLARSPKQYKTCPFGSERPRQKHLGWWDRFILADGPIPSLARFAVAGGILASLVAAESYVASKNLVAFNGLETPVTLQVNNHRLTLQPGEHAALELDSLEVSVSAFANNALIEEFKETLAGTHTTVYNVASAASLVQWTVAYGKSTDERDVPLGAPRWIGTPADYVFEDAPTELRTDAKGTTRAVLVGRSDPASVAQIDSDEQREKSVAAHLRFDPSDAADFEAWAHWAAASSPLRAILAERIAASPREVVLLRAEQDIATGADHAQVCARHRSAAEGSPEDSQLAYLAARCLEDDVARDRAFLAAHQRFPTEGWLTQAAAFVHCDQEDWQEASQLFAQARRALPFHARDLVEEEARVLRLLDFDPERIHELTVLYPQLDQQLALESGRSSLPIAAELAAIREGRLDDALRSAQRDPSAAGYLLALAAASDGASDAIMGRYFQQSAQQGGRGFSWTRLALAFRAGKDIKGIVAAASVEERPEVDAVLVWFGQLQKLLAGKDGRALDPETRALVAQFDAIARTKPPSRRGRLHSLALTVFGKSAPWAWRYEVQRLLFAGEHPYFGPPISRAEYLKALAPSASF